MLFRSAGSLEPSHVLQAMYGADDPRISETLRFSFGRYNTLAEIETVADKLAELCQRLKK